MRSHGAELVLDPPLVGRVFRTTRPVRFGDTSPRGRVRLDALARYQQDIAGDDTLDAGIDDPHPWVVRRGVVEVHVPAVGGEALDLATWCSGTGSHWAERRVSIQGRRGADGVGEPLGPRGRRHRPAGAAGRRVRRGLRVGRRGRRVTARLQHDTTVPDDVERSPWRLRFVDFDILGHVNNAGAWAIVEEVLAQVDDGPSWPRRVEVEFREPIVRGDDVVVCHRPPVGPDGEVHLWVQAGAPGVAPTVRTTAAPSA